MREPSPTRVTLPLSSDTPRGDADGFRRWMRKDMTAGFLVFLIALPLCLGISVASGFPPVAGIFTAVVGACLTTFLSDSELTIKGPAAGLIVIVLGAMQAFGYTAGQDPAKDLEAYRLTLAVGCVAGVVQVAFGLLRTGLLGEFFPTAVVHGMLAAIGVIIILKQVPVMLGGKAASEPLEILREMPETILHLNPAIAFIGLSSLAILMAMPWLKRRVSGSWLGGVPAQLVVLVVAVPMAWWLGLATDHTYAFGGQDHPLGPRFLVNVPASLRSALTFPDFGAFSDPSLVWGSIKWVVMFALVGNLESMLSAKAIDMVDPWKRKTTLDRDLVAVGTANVVAAAVGGLPMISEIVRSKANIDNGARTRFADFWHGIFLLAFVALAPWLIRSIPLAALAAMLVYTGSRLASPSEFISIWRIGREQMVIFASTIVGVLATDLLVGVIIGVGVKFLIHAINGLPLSTIFKPFLEVRVIDDKTVQIDAVGSAVFSNWLPFRAQIEKLGLLEGNNVIVNLEGTRLVDHSVLEKLHQLEDDFCRAGLRLEIVGLEGHRPLSSHPFATRKRAV
ncbi:MAG: SulP family inorganic anion transporter [Planctomycetota bacterium]|nr:SulP family inorganic anion transporter [Planctomycetota bacterium]